MINGIESAMMQSERRNMLWPIPISIAFKTVQTITFFINTYFDFHPYVRMITLCVRAKVIASLPVPLFEGFGIPQYSEEKHAWLPSPIRDIYKHVWNDPFDNAHRRTHTQGTRGTLCGCALINDARRSRFYMKLGHTLRNDMIFTQPII